MEEKIIHTFRENKRRYGSRRIVKDLCSSGNRISRYTAGKVLRAHGLKLFNPVASFPGLLIAGTLILSVLTSFWIGLCLRSLTKYG